jgi:hypothetical protein
MKNKKINLNYPAGLSLEELTEFFTDEFLKNKEIINLVKNDQYQEFENYVSKTYVLLDSSTEKGLAAMDEMILGLIYNKMKAYE